jgi:two-component system, OmpR family, sensor histidine kinase VicK
MEIKNEGTTKPRVKMNMNSKSLLKECALCGNQIQESTSAPVEESIGGTSYIFDTKDCAIMFKRFHAIYGDDFEELSGNPPRTDTATQEIKVESIEKKIKQRGRLRREKSGVVKIIKAPLELLRLSYELVTSARKEIQLVFSSARLFNYYYHYQRKSSGLFMLVEMPATEKGLDVKIITPADEEIKAIFARRSPNELPRIQIRYIEEISPLNNDIMILVVDGKQSLAIKLKENRQVADSSESKDYHDVAQNQDDALEEMIELGTYSNNKSIVLSYAIVFETLWRQLELNKQVSGIFEKQKAQDNTKTDLLSIAAHELRDPIQPVLGLAEMLQSRKDIHPEEQEEFLAIIIRNAKRLKDLTENILDLTKIEGQSSLSLNKELVDIKDIIQRSILGIKSQLSGNQSVEIKIKDNSMKGHSVGQNSDAVLVRADGSKLMQVISNLLSNAVKFTDVGEIMITIETRVDTGDSTNKSGNMEVIVSIKDSGQGIDPSMMPRLFEKFATKSNKGTGLGLGLFISKSIITHHGGKIWAENNPEGKGATFAFSLPLSS